MIRGGVLRLLKLFLTSLCLCSLYRDWRVIGADGEKLTSTISGDASLAIITFNPDECSSIGFVMAGPASDTSDSCGSTDTNGCGVLYVRTSSCAKEAAGDPTVWPPLDMADECGNMQVVSWAVEWGKDAANNKSTSGRMKWSLSSEDCSAQNTARFESGVLLCNDDYQTALLLVGTDTTYTVLYTKSPEFGPGTGYQQLNPLLASRSDRMMCTSDMTELITRVATSVRKTDGADGLDVGDPVEHGGTEAAAIATSSGRFAGFSSCMQCEAGNMFDVFSSFPKTLDGGMSDKPAPSPTPSITPDNKHHPHTRAPVPTHVSPPSPTPSRTRPAAHDDDDGYGVYDYGDKPADTATSPWGISTDTFNTTRIFHHSLYWKKRANSVAMLFYVGGALGLVGLFMVSRSERRRLEGSGRSVRHNDMTFGRQGGGNEHGSPF